MNEITFSNESIDQVTDLMREQIRTAAGGKALEFGSTGFSLAKTLRRDLEYLACSDKTETFPENLRSIADAHDIHLIPDQEMGEDCYFGRFHMVYTLFGFRGLPHLVDEIMRLRRLIIKGGKMVIVDWAEAQFDAECVKQLKRCGFQNITVNTFMLEGQSAFLISAEK